VEIGAVIPRFLVVVLVTVVGAIPAIVVVMVVELPLGELLHIVLGGEVVGKVCEVIGGNGDI